MALTEKQIETIAAKTDINGLNEHIDTLSEGYLKEDIAYAVEQALKENGFDIDNMSIPVDYSVRINVEDTVENVIDEWYELTVQDDDEVEAAMMNGLSPEIIAGHSRNSIEVVINESAHDYAVSIRMIQDVGAKLSEVINSEAFADLLKKEEPERSHEAVLSFMQEVGYSNEYALDVLDRDAFKLFAEVEGDIEENLGTILEDMDFDADRLMTETDDKERFLLNHPELYTVGAVLDDEEGEVETFSPDERRLIIEMTESSQHEIDHELMNEFMVDEYEEALVDALEAKGFDFTDEHTTSLVDYTVEVRRSPASYYVDRLEEMTTDIRPSTESLTTYGVSAAWIQDIDKDITFVVTVNETRDEYISRTGDSLDFVVDAIVNFVRDNEADLIEEIILENGADFREQLRIASIEEGYPVAYDGEIPHTARVVYKMSPELIAEDIAEVSNGYDDLKDMVAQHLSAFVLPHLDYEIEITEAYQDELEDADY